jgi:catechol 2,3-dioxygenase-like lactoylglutathione lyase family enzyme
MIPISGLYEAHLTVASLERSIAFYRDIIGLELAYVIPERHVAFFWVGGRERSMLGLWSIHTSPNQLKLHIAFNVTEADVVRSVEALQAKGITPRDGAGAAIEEPTVFPWMPAAAVYFDDPDGHALEYIAILPDAPRRDINGVMPLSVWRALVRKRA